MFTCISWTKQKITALWWTTKCINLGLKTVHGITHILHWIFTTATSPQQTSSAMNKTCHRLILGIKQGANALYKRCTFNLSFFAFFTYSRHNNLFIQNMSV